MLRPSRHDRNTVQPGTAMTVQGKARLLGVGFFRSAEKTSEDADRLRDRYLALGLRTPGIPIGFGSFCPAPFALDQGLEPGDLNLEKLDLMGQIVPVACHVTAQVLIRDHDTGRSVIALHPLPAFPLNGLSSRFRLYTEPVGKFSIREEFRCHFALRDSCHADCSGDWLRTFSP